MLNNAYFNVGNTGKWNFFQTVEEAQSAVKLSYGHTFSILNVMFAFEKCASSSQAHSFERMVKRILFE